MAQPIARQTNPTLPCPNCGADVAPDEDACPECGADAEFAWGPDADLGGNQFPVGYSSDDYFDDDEIGEHAFSNGARRPLGQQLKGFLRWLILVLLTIAVIMTCLF